MSKKYHLFGALAIVSIFLVAASVIIFFITSSPYALIPLVVTVPLLVFSFINLKKASDEHRTNANESLASIEQDILKNNDIESFEVSKQFKEKYKISFTEFRELVREQLEQTRKQNENGIRGKERALIGLSIHKSLSSTRYIIHEPLPSEYFLFYPDCLLIFDWNNKKYKFNERINFPKTPLLEIILYYWTKENVSFYKNCSISEFDKILIPIKSIIDIKNDIQMGSHTHGNSGLETAIKAEAVGVGYALIDAANTASLGTTYTARSTYIFKFDKSLGMPDLAYEAYNTTFNPTLGLKEKITINKVLDYLYYHPHVSQLRESKELLEKLEDKYKKGLITKKQYNQEKEKLI